MVAIFLDDNKTNDDGDGKEMHVHHAILYISLPSLHHYDMKLPNFTSPLYRVGEHNTKNCPFYFRQIIMVPKKISPRFAKIEIK